MIELYTDSIPEESVRDYEELRIQYLQLQEKYEALLKEYEELKQSRSKAGRRPNDEKWTAKYRAFAALKEQGYKREDIQQKLNMSRATYFRYNKIYCGQEPADVIHDLAVSEIQQIVESADTSLAEPVKELVAKPVVEIATTKTDIATETTAAVSEPEKNSSHEGLVLDEETGEYVTPEGLKRRRKLAAIRARRAAEEQAKALEEQEEIQNG